MSYFASNAKVPAWAADTPRHWQLGWLKWSVALSTEKATVEELERLPYISNEDIEPWTGRILHDHLKPSAAHGSKFKADDVLLNKLRPYLAKVYHADIDGVSSGELLCLRPSKRILPRFLFYVLASKGFIDGIDAETFGSKMPRADWECVGHQPLPVPPLDVQRRIARFLDEETALIDTLIAKKRALLDRLAEKRQALITRAVTQGLDPDAPRKPSGIEWLGEIPAHWEVLPLRRIALNVSTGRTPPMADDYDSAEAEFNWYTPGDFSTEIELQDSERKISNRALEDGNATLYPPGTLMLVGIGATLGKIAVSIGHGSANQQVTAIVLDLNNNPHYFAYFLHGFRQEVRVMSNGNTLGILNQDGTKSLTVLKPPLDEQQRISALLKDRDVLHADLRVRTQLSLNLLAEYRAALVTAAVTGQIESLR